MALMGAATSKRRGGSAAAVLDFAVAQILGDDTALGALPAVLARMVEAFGLRAALAFQPSGGQPSGGQPSGGQPSGGRRSATEQPAVLAAHPPGAVDHALLARIGVVTAAQRNMTPGSMTPGSMTRGDMTPVTKTPGDMTVGARARGEGAESPLVVTLDGQPGSVLLARSVPVDGQCLCALALIGDTPAPDAEGSDEGGWDAEVRSTAHAVAAIVATQIRHANDMTALAERQVLTRALIAGAPIAVLAMDADGRLIEFNPAAERLSGYRRDDVLGQSLSEILVPERDRPRILEYISTYLATGNPEECTGQLRVPTLHADGTERVAELTPVPITIGGRTIFTGFLRDLTEIERSHAELADQTERLNCLIASAIPGVLITDERGTVTNVSQSFGTMFGRDEPLAGPQLAGTQGAAVLRRVAREFADPVRFARRAVAVLRARQPMTGEQLTCADGRTVEWDYWPVLVDGRHRGDIWLAWDMSDRKALERQRIEAQRQLAEQNERLRKLDEARNQFLAIVSHELRTPLTSIVSFSELIKGEAEGLTPEGVKFLDIIERNADRLHRLVGDLLMLDRLEAGALPLDLAPVSVADLTAEAVRSAAPAAAKQGIAIEVKTREGPIVAADHRRLMQVLDNLIANAVKFSHRNQRVLVTAGYHGDQWRIDVSDSGIGIPPAEAGQLFNRFVRGSNARTAGLPGTGLGLSIVKVLTEMHGGHVEVDSTLGRGSTFSVYLPETENGS
jgi:PAS domain S-box-containing protein